MSHHFLRDLAKVGVGLVIADLLSVIWLATTGLLPVTILGVSWSTDMIPAVVVFDAALLVCFAHLGWNVRMPVTSPSERTLLLATGTIFLCVAVLHFLRLVFSLPLALGDFMIPLWLSWLGFAITLYFAYSNFHYALHSRRA
jgi:hypothetical protein